MTTAEIEPHLEAAQQLAARSGGEPIGLRDLLIGPTALDSLPAIVKELAVGGPIVLMEDSTVMMRGSEELKPLIAAMLKTVGDVRWCVIGPPDGAVHADPMTMVAARECAVGAGILVTVGSGTLTDIGKEVARTCSIPLVAIQTAASVNGYADNMAVLLKDGVKRTVPSVWPSALVIDTKVVADAPPALTRSGFGEMMAMFTAPADWMLAATVGQDSHFDPKVVELFRDSGQDFLASAAGVSAGDEEAISLLARLLTASGLAMGVSSVTAPLSGTEHLISHMLDMSAGVDNRPVGLHGAQVGVASLVAACLWEHLLDRLEPADFLRESPDSEEMRMRVAMAFASLDPSGRTSAECWSGYRQKLALWEVGRGRRVAMASSWSSLKGDLAAMVGDPAEMAEALRSAGAPAGFGQLDPPIATGRVHWAVSSCHLMRDRFTVADLAYLTGHWTQHDIEAVLDRTATLAGD